MDLQPRSQLNRKKNQIEKKKFRFPKLNPHLTLTQL